MGEISQDLPFWAKFHEVQGMSKKNPACEEWCFSVVVDALFLSVQERQCVELSTFYWKHAVREMWEELTCRMISTRFTGPPVVVEVTSLRRLLDL